mgnify:CR=1 FL=1
MKATRIDQLHEAVHQGFRKAKLRADMKVGGGYVIEEYVEKKGWVVVAECSTYRTMMKKMREIRGIER